MTIPSFLHRRRTLGLPLLVALVVTVIVFSPLFGQHPLELSTAVTLDLVVTAPLLYWLAARGKGNRGAAAAKAAVAGLLAASLLLYGRPHPLLTWLRIWISPVLEAVLLFILVRALYRARKAGGKAPGADFPVRGREVLGTALNNTRVGDIVISEFAVFYYICFAGKKPVDNRMYFSYHKGNGILLVLGVLLTCFMIETAGLHLLISLLSLRLAWWLTSAGIYAMLQIIAHMRAVKRRPIRLEGGRLCLRNGLAGDTDIALDDIDRIEYLSPRGALERIPGEQLLTLLGRLERPNIRLWLKREVILYRPFGIRRKAAIVSFYIDHANEFMEAVPAERNERQRPFRG